LTLTQAGTSHIATMMGKVTILEERKHEMHDLRNATFAVTHERAVPALRYAGERRSEPETGDNCRAPVLRRGTIPFLDSAGHPRSWERWKRGGRAQGIAPTGRTRYARSTEYACDGSAGTGVC